MSEETNEEYEFDNEETQDNQQGDEGMENVIPLSGMYKDWFLDYASYVILERAVPHVNDGFKPVQRRIMHSMKELEDGRYNKVANIIGNTMKYHPHGDASIGDAIVQIGQKNLLIDTQGNWGNILTGDGSAAPRYIEARLTKFALDVIFNPKTTTWQASYDGRNDEPVTLPVKFPILLAHGAEGIAVGMACKILPHNFGELIDACIGVLRGKKPNIVPDFPTGGMMDASNYNDGLRGGKVKVRAKIEKVDSKTLSVTELPFTCTTTSLIDSILKANDKGKIKIKKVEDNTAEFVEILIHLGSGVSPDKMIDGLYAFTDCEVSISPNSAIIENDRPHFMPVSEILKHSANQTRDLLQLELEIRQRELEEQWHFASLERIFIEKRIYRRIEECETWEEVIAQIRLGLTPYIGDLQREVTDEDIVRLTEIKIKRISKFDSFKAEENILKIEAELAEIKHNIENIVDFAVDYFKTIKKKYAADHPRKTEIRAFENIVATRVVVSNKKLYVNREEGFIGHNMKKDEYVCDCSDIDDIIVIRKDGTLKVVKIDSKVFIGKDIMHVAVWKKGDKRTTYNLIYSDGPKGNVMVKRFNVPAITRDREYPLTKGTKGSKIMYFSANPNGEAEVVSLQLKEIGNIRKLNFEYDFAKLAIKGRAAAGNILSKHPIKKVTLKKEGVSTLAAMKIWFDDTVQRINNEGRGELLGEFSGEDKILVVYQSGEFKLYGYGLSVRFDSDIVSIEKWEPNRAMTAIYFDGEKDQFNVKRFLIDSTDRKVKFITDHDKSYLEVISTDKYPVCEIEFKKIKGKKKDNETIELAEKVNIRSIKAIGNRLVEGNVKVISMLESLPEDEEDEEIDDYGEDFEEDFEEGQAEMFEE